MKHTPGPWHVANGVQIRSATDQIAKVWMMRNGEGQANARLIAAAPELAELVRYWFDSKADSAVIAQRGRELLAKLDA
jgi:hypothetical protein